MYRRHNNEAFYVTWNAVLIREVHEFGYVHHSTLHVALPKDTYNVIVYEIGVLKEQQIIKKDPVYLSITHD